MPITINGTGTITGISAGGLPDACIVADDLASNAVTTAKVADANITAAKLDGAQSGSAPIYGARAWVNFNGTFATSPFTIANGGIRASGNVSSVTDNGTGDYTVNFTTAMPDANYSALGTASSWSPHTSTTTVVVAGDRTTARTTSAFRVFTRYGNSDVVVDPDVVSVSILR